ncbi:MAG: hypothetical protein CVV25_13175 [Ignavibacteriae bacterium HGW-Ignavibacteriae-4]|nr:MAG: hypothetical protein CVV25_13175 [Ignavibacteriae bacterium HGW-Ignavibacteriae-4]
MNINDRIKQIVETDYKSQSSLAKELGVSRVTIGSYVNNESKPNTEILEKFYDLGYNINWLISGKGTIKRHFVNENELDEYDRIAFEGYISFYLSSNDNYIKENHIIKKVIVNNDSSTTIIENRSHPEIAGDISDIIILELYTDGVISALYSELYKSKFYEYLDYLLTTNNNETSEYFTNSFISDISSQIRGRPSKNKIIFKLNKILSENEESEFYFNLACLYYLLTEIVDFETMVDTQIISEFSRHTLDIVELKPMFKYLIDQIRNNNYVETKGNRYKSSIKDICKIEYE